jgi:hypothetical protein
MSEELFVEAITSEEQNTSLNHSATCTHVRSKQSGTLQYIIFATYFISAEFLISVAVLLSKINRVPYPPKV